MAAAEAADGGNVVAAQLMDGRCLPAPACVSDGGAEHPHGQVEAVVR